MTQKGDSTVEVKARKDRGVVVVVVLVDVVLPVPVPVVFVPLAESTIFTGLMLLTLAVPVSVPPLLLVSILKDEDIMITTTTATMDFECSLRPLLFCKFRKLRPPWSVFDPSDHLVVPPRKFRPLNVTLWRRPA